jgi:multiple sugar transport system ATP-binding protein
MARLTIKNLSKKFDSKVILEDVNLVVEDGELAVLLGPSGCGKSTLLRCIAGLERPDEGSIFIDDELINYKEPRDRNVAMVFQYYALYPHMTVRQNMSLGLEHTTNLDKVEIQKRVEEMANLLKISKLLDRKPAQLSGGEAQRVAIGRALVRKPRIFLLDEPLSAVDAKLRRELRTEIKRLQRKIGVTTIYVTHDQEEAMAIGDKLIIMEEGQIHQIGSSEEIYNNPKNKFVAGFVGKPSMNFLDLEIKNKDQKYYLENETISYEISKEFYNSHLSNYEKKRLTIGVRPSDIKIISKQQKNSIQAVVILVESRGSENHIHILLDSIRMIVKADIEVRPNIHDKVNIFFEEENIYLFDYETGDSLKYRF